MNLKLLKYIIPALIIGFLAFGVAYADNANYWLLNNNFIKPLNSAWGLQLPNISSQCLHTNASGQVSGTGSDCGSGSSLPLPLLANGTVAGVNATSSTVSFNVQGSGSLNPFTVASSSGTSYLTVLANGNVGIGTTTPIGALSVVTPATTTVNTNFAYFGGSDFDSNLVIRAKRISPGVTELYDTINNVRGLSISQYGVGIGTGSILAGVNDAAFGYFQGHAFFDGLTSYPVIAENTSGSSNGLTISHTSTNGASDVFTIQTDRVATSSRPTLAIGGKSISFFTSTDGTCCFSNNTAGTSRMTITDSGVGISSSTPVAPLSVTGHAVIDNSDNLNSVIGTVPANTVFSPGNGLSGALFVGRVNLNSNVVGMWSNSTLIATGTATTLRSQALNYGANDASTSTTSLTSVVGGGSLVGGRGVISHDGSGDMTEMSVVSGLVRTQNSTGTVTSARFLNAENPTISSGTTVTNLSALEVKGGSVSGTVTNRYGVLIDDLIGGTNRYGIYQVGASDLNYFGGKIGIASATPAGTLGVTGNVVIDNVGGSTSYTKIGPTASSSGIAIINPGDALVVGSIGSTNVSRAILATAEYTGSNVSGTAQGFNASADDTGNSTNFTQVSSGGTLRNRAQVTHAGTGTMLEASALSTRVLTTTGAGTVTDMADYNAEGATVVAGTTLTNLYGLHARNSAVAGTLTNHYGFFSDQLTDAVKNYAIYASGTTQSYFGGNLGVGITSPTFPLEVSYTNTSATTLALAINNTNTSSGQSGFGFSFGGVVVANVRADYFGDMIYASLHDQYFAYPNDFGNNVTAHFGNDQMMFHGANGTLSVGGDDNSNILTVIGNGANDVINARSSGGTSYFKVDLNGKVAVSTSTPDSNLDVYGNVRLEGSSFVVTPVISGAIIGTGCDSATTSVDSTISSSTAAFITTPQNDPGTSVSNVYSFLSSPGVITTRVCGVGITPNSTKYNVKIIK